MAKDHAPEEAYAVSQHKFAVYVSIALDVVVCHVLQGLLIEAAWPQPYGIRLHNELSTTAVFEPAWHGTKTLGPKVLVIHAIELLACEPEVGLPQVISNAIDDLQQKCSVLLSLPRLSSLHCSLFNQICIRLSRKSYAAAAWSWWSLSVPRRLQYLQQQTACQYNFLARTPLCSNHTLRWWLRLEYWEAAHEAIDGFSLWLI